jgi:hypothetical protein
MNEAFNVLVRIEMRSGNDRNHQFEFGFKADTRRGVEEALLEVAAAVKALPRSQNGWERAN